MKTKRQNHPDLNIKEIGPVGVHRKLRGQRPRIDATMQDPVNLGQCGVGVERKDKWKAGLNQREGSEKDRCNLTVLPMDFPHDRRSSV